MPITPEIATQLGVPSVMTGFALPDCGAHSPNEKLHLETWRRGIEAVVRFVHYLAVS